MDEQRAWLRARRKRRLRIFAVILCLCVLFTAYPNILVTLSVFATGKPEQTQGQYVSGFAKLPEEIREQTVLVGTTLSELTLPDTLEAVMTGHQSYEDGEKEPEDDAKDKADAGDETAGDITDTGDNNGSTEEPEEGGPSDTEQEDTETDGGTEDKDTETGDGEDVQPEDGGESGETDESTITDNEDETDTDNGEGGEGESAPAEEQETHTVTMPEYLAENVISVQTLENTSTEEQEETQAEQEEATVTIEGVAWQSEPEYSGSTEGTYIFTAVLPEGYTLEEGGA